MTLENLRILVEVVLNNSEKDAIMNLNEALADGNCSIGAFYEAVIEHANGLQLSSDQWLDFHKKTRHWRLLREKPLMDKLSPLQRRKLGLN